MTETRTDMRTDIPEEDGRESPEMTTEQIARAGTDGSNGGRASADAQVQLLPDTEKFASRWDEIQATFVDEPRQAVERADGLVADVIQELARTFADERKRLEQDWAGGNDVSTESLRVALQRYRDFFHVLLRS